MLDHKLQLDCGEGNKKEQSQAFPGGAGVRTDVPERIKRRTPFFTHALRPPLSRCLIAASWPNETLPDNMIFSIEEVPWEVAGQAPAIQMCGGNIPIL